MRPPVVAILDDVAFHFLAIVSQNSLHRTLESVFNERELEKPVPSNVCVSHLNEKV